MAILDSRTETTPGGVRLYTGPKFARCAGRWSAIDDLLSVQRDGDAPGGTFRYVVALGDEYITMAPASAGDKAALAESLTEDIVEPTHFGPKLDPKLLTADRLTWRLDWSKGVRAEADSLVFPGVEGVALGVFFNAWRDALKDDCTIDLAAKTVDLRLARALDFAKAAGIESINLDPETIKVTDAPAAFRHHSRENQAPGSWVATQTAAESLTNSAVLRTLAVNISCQVGIGRTALTFNLSTYGLPLAAYLYLYKVGASATAIRLTTPGEDYESPLTSSGNYPLIIQQGIGTNWTAMGGNWIRSPEIVAVIGRRLLYQLGIKDPFDTPPDVPGFANENSYTSSGANAGYLEITLPELVPGGTSTSTATAKGHRR